MATAPKAINVDVDARMATPVQVVSVVTCGQRRLLQWATWRPQDGPGFVDVAYTAMDGQTFLDDPSDGGQPVVIDHVLFTAYVLGDG